MSDWKDPRISERTVHRCAWRIYRRLCRAGGRSLPYEDVLQEMWLAWCKAVETYDPDINPNFQAYLWNGMMQHGITVYRKQVSYRFQELHAVSFDQPVTSNGEDSLADFYTDPDQRSAEQAVIEESVFANISRRLSDEARIVVNLMRNQPPELVEAFTHFNYKAEQARSMNVPYAKPSALRISVIFDLMGLSRSRRAEVLDELRAASEIALSHAR